MYFNTKLIWLIFVLIGYVLCSCSAGAESVESTPSPQATGTATPGFSKLQELRAIWRRGSHSKISFESEYAQPYCAKCHSPQDWDPKANPGETPGCAEAIVKPQHGATGGGDAQLNSTATWHAVECKTCHLIGRDGDPLRGIIWWNQETGKAETISESIDLCTKCHTKTSDVDNSVDLGNDEFHTTLSCVACHDPHSTTASCTNTGCHPNVEEHLTIITDLAIEPNHETAPPGGCSGGTSCHMQSTQVAEQGLLPHIGVYHTYLTCAACHDGAGMEVGPVDGSFMWTTFQTVEWNGLTAKRPKYSHVITTEVDCARCHFEGNPWELAINVGDEVNTPVR